ncbi:hypothetical protein SODALDRAFT_53529 [Sodiomyces alkalinus F11]|uniref:Zn(2)-C6 fungal-type domain-containing protein n=1 Tax=Sodiomyces alkalinus (strain CBS 110278 / VKM F-3762 / F11) TaxID=1314773 RepID=A0A3N2PN02_SODAK|nr:hypothetical protein SODALDRAFT_53529 [Sodiomyces alkalinus F11]ROT35895.1 hypothetical protein SODALDRAFT_53529 [Sodiomyces alkalinus F11]
MDTRQPSRLLPLLPARTQAVNDSSGSFSGAEERNTEMSRDIATSNRPKRTAISVACENCRRSKAKCDGARPFCHRCAARDEDCVYRADVNETASQALKRKHRALQLELAQYKELFNLLRDRPVDEAQEIFRRVRTSSEPAQVLHAIRHAEILLPSPSTDEWVGHAQLAKLDRDALTDSAIKVSARPWTSVVGDGLVSELITSFFVWDDTYWFASVDRDAFLEDMATGDVRTAKWCSPFLVNAICALRCHFVDRAKQFGAITRQNMAERFFEEAKSLLDREQGRSSLPTAQALAIMYFVEAGLGRDRASQLYRFAALAMISRLGLERRFTALNENDPGVSKERRAISRALWGLYLQESRVAFYYYQPSILPLPRVPKLFDYGGAAAADNGMANVDVLGQPLEESSDKIPLVPGTLTLSCELSQLWNELMQHLTAPQTVRGSDYDVRLRKVFYTRLRRFREDLSGRFRVENNFTPSTCFIRMHENEVAHTILQTLPYETHFETPFTSRGTLVKDLVLEHCRSDIELAEVYLQKWPYEAMSSRVLHVATQTLVPILDDPVTHDLFTRGCVMMRLASRVMKVMGRMLQAVQALAWALDKPIPVSARVYLEDWGQDAVEKDLPVSFVLPQREEIRKLLASGVEDTDVESLEGQLGVLIEKWAKLRP